MRTGQLVYDGTTYSLTEPAVADLVARGVIIPDPMNEDCFDLAAEHVIEEVEPFATFDGFRAGDDVRGESQVEGRARLRALSFQYHRDGQGLH